MSIKNVHIARENPRRYAWAQAVADGSRRLQTRHCA